MVCLGIMLRTHLLSTFLACFVISESTLGRQKAAACFAADFIRQTGIRLLVQLNTSQQSMTLKVALLFRVLTF